MTWSLNYVLLLVEFAFLFTLFRQARRGDSLPTQRLSMFWLWIAGYSAVAIYLGSHDVFVSKTLLKFYPGLWLTAVTVVACVTPVVVNSGLREDLRRAVDATPRGYFICFQMLRLAALGTLIGAAQGDFPVYFELLVGIPDLAFALSAFGILWMSKAEKLTDRQFFWWNLVGVLVIVPSAPILLQLGLPGPLQVFTAEPDARAVLTFPMSIAPLVVVPILVLMNLLVVWRLLETRIAGDSRRSSARFAKAP